MLGPGTFAITRKRATGSLYRTIAQALDRATGERQPERLTRTRRDPLKRLTWIPTESGGEE